MKQAFMRATSSAVAVAPFIVPNFGAAIRSERGHRELEGPGL